mgnify:CR=1 FL=1
MKRILLCWMLLALLTGCGKAGEPVPEEVPEEAEALSGEELVSSAMAAYAAITEDLTFTLDVEEDDAAGINLSITPESAWNVAGRENLFPDSYRWEPSSAKAWGEQWSDIKSRGRLFAMSAPDGEATLQCCAGGDVVMWNVDGEAHYALVTAVEDGGPGLDDLLRGIAEDALREAAFSAPTVDDAVPKLARIENQISQILASIGSKSHVLDGAERLALLNSQLNPLKPFNFDYRRDISARMVQTTKDCIAPMTLDFKPEGLADCFKTGDMWGQVLVIKKLGSELTDQALSDITELPIPLNVTWFAQPMDKAAAVAFTRQRLAWIDKEIIEEQRSAVQKGYDFSILPQELKYSKEETEDVIDNLQNKNQRLYVFTGLFYTYAPTKKQLDNQVLSIISAARQNSIEVSTYEYRQRQGFNSILPLGHNHCEISRMSTTAEVSILMPFATMELDDKGGNYYGQNKHSSNLIFCNRKLLASPMGFVCGKTGSGKGMAVKTEMTGTILSNPTDEIYIIDRAGEYTGISSRYGGVTYNFAVDSDTYLNPFDTVSVESLSPDAQLAFKIDAMLAQAGASAAEAGRDLGEEDQSIITRCVQEAFFDARQRGEQPPLLEDFYNKLLEQPEPEAKTIALRYERFVTGAQSFFNHQSNVDFKSRIVDFNLKDLPDSMLVFGLINVCEAVRNRMYFNAKRGVRTWLYVEEMQSMFAYPTVLNYFSRFSNEGRKFGLLLTGISQNAVAMLKNKAAQNLVLNSDFLLLLKQSPLDRAEWVRLLGLSEQEEEFIDESVEPGDGLLIAGGARVPIRGKFPSGNVLYDLFSTNPNEAADKKRMQEFAAREKSRLE